MNDIIFLIFLTFLPFLELRASIPYGILVLDMHFVPVFFICVLTNMVLGPIVYLLLDKVMHLRFSWMRNLYDKYVQRTQRRIHGAVERWGELGVALFIGVPLPGSGSYSGALGSYVIGLGFKKFVIANIFGNLIAGTVVTIVSLTGGGLANWFIKII